MSSTLFLLKRYLLPREGNLLSFALWVSVGGVALGIAVLILVLSVMTGFLGIFQDKYTNITSEVVVLPRHGRPVEPKYRDKILAVPGVKAATPFAIGQGLVFKTSVGGVTLEGVDVKTTGSVTPWKEVWVNEPKWDLQKKTPHWIWLGRGIAEKLKVKEGDEVSLMIGVGEEGVIPFTVTAITKFGIYEHDQRYAYIDFALLNRYFHHGENEPMYKVRVHQPSKLNETAASIKKALGGTAGVKKWSEINQNIFLAVAHQKHMLFLVMEIIVALAGVNVINLLLMSSHHRRRDVAILRAMGMKFKSVVAFFVIQGTAVGLVGIVFGVGLGYLFCFIVDKLQPAILSEAIYNVSRLPIRTDPLDVVLICVVAFGVCVLFSVVPAWQAARSRPVATLRYD